MNGTPMPSRRSTSPWIGIAALGLATTVAAAGVSGTGSRLWASAEPQAGPAATVVTPAPLPGSPVQSYSQVVDQVAPAVVTIRVEKTAVMSQTAMPGLPEGFEQFFGRRSPPAPQRRREGGLGSGVIVRADGLVLTNHHVVDGATRMRADLADGRSFPATLVGSDAASDLAVLRIAATGLPVVPYGDSERIKVGDVVLAFGNPLGVGQTVTMGIVSAKGRATGAGDGAYEDFLQTDAPINHGNSGGALVNLQGELVGINAQILSPSGGNIGLGFAIPSAMAQAVAEQLVTDGVVHRARLGVTVQGLTSELAESLGVPEARGALVSEVEPDSPAERAGVQQGDVVLHIDGKPVTDANRAAQSDCRLAAWRLGDHRRAARWPRRNADGAPGRTRAGGGRRAGRGGERPARVGLRHGGHAAHAADCRAARAAEDGDGGGRDRCRSGRAGGVGRHSRGRRHQDRERPGRDLGRGAARGLEDAAGSPGAGAGQPPRQRHLRGAAARRVVETGSRAGFASRDANPAVDGQPPRISPTDDCRPRRTSKLSDRASLEIPWLT